jgi:transmembrane sensor
MSASTSSNPPYTDAQRREASDWFVIIGEDSAPNAESIQAWLKWMDQHEGNRAAFDAVAHAWHGVPVASLQNIPTGEELSADDYQGDESVEEWLSNRRVKNDTAVSSATCRVAKVRIPRRAWVAATLAAASILVALAGLLALNRYLGPGGPHSEEFTTRTGEQMRVTLSDGSDVWLGPKSRLLVSFDPVRRGTQLTSGEAFFSVRKDRSRPFAVQSAGGDIVAVGTAFNVRAIDQQVTVAVSEGVVAVTPKAQLTVREPASLRVASGQQLTFTAREPVKALAIVESPSPGERARWREGVLVYRDEPLQDVVNDLLRYSDVPIEIADPAVGELHYSGLVYHDAIQEWVKALPQVFPVTIVRNGNREIIKARSIGK